MLPVAAPGQTGTRVELAVIVDATSYLPRRIAVWEQPTGAPTRLVAVIDVGSIEHLEPDPGGQLFSLQASPDTRFTQLDPSGRPVRVLGRRAVTPAEAARAVPGGRWLGRRFQGIPLDSITLLHTTGGNVLRLRYGDLTLWDFGSVVPPQLLADQLLPGKSFALPDGSVARFYVAGGDLVAERDSDRGSVAVVAPSDSKLDLLEAVQAATPLP